MRKHAGFAAALTVAALGVALWTKSGVLSAPIGPVSFADRWASVDEALRSNKFVVRYPDIDAPGAAASVVPTR